MSTDANISAADKFFIGEDKIFEFEVLDVNNVPIDVSSWELKYSMRKTVQGYGPFESQGGTEVVSKLTGGFGITLTGAYNVDRVTNTQRIRVTIASSDTDALKAGVYVHTLKRTDAGSEQIIADGTVDLLLPATR